MGRARGGQVAAMKRQLAKLSRAELIKRVLYAERTLTFAADVNSFGLSMLRIGREA
jgi:hypothetical protein